MDIFSLQFVIPTIASAFIFYLINIKYRVYFLLLLSCGFILSLNYLLLPYVLFYSVVNYIIGIKLPDSKHKNLLYWAGIVFNLSQLILLRYASFTLDPVFELFGSSIAVSKLSEIIVPIGVSYFTLQGIGYIINLKMGWEKPESSFPAFLLYIVFFPKFMSGPIERSNHFLPQLKENKNFNGEQVSKGLRIAMFGFLKKLVIANQMAPFVVSTVQDIQSADGAALLLLLLILPVYLYFDFSGYTDIAIGFSRMFGLDLLPNFNRPFFAVNVTTFWKRFHISLASWFGDYIFRQTLFKRRKWGVYASMYGVFITWVLFGIWHGAGWNFMLLGFVQAVAINYEFFTRKWRYKLFSKLPKVLGMWIGRTITYLFYGASLVFFFAPDVKSAFVFFSGIFSINESIPRLFLDQIPLSAILLVVAYFVYELINEDFTKISDKLNKFWFRDEMKITLLRWTVYSFILTMLFVLGNKVQQFIYVQF